MRRPDAPLSVEIPAPMGDRPAWGKVGIIAAVGFVLGIAWPSLTSTRIAPHPPGEGAASAASSATGPSAAVAEPNVAPAKLAAAAASAGPSERIAVGHGAILNCRDQGEESAEDCGSLEFDPVAVPRIKALAQCPGAAGAAGKLSIGFDVDFRRKEVRVMNGKSTTLPKEKADALVKCADIAFDKVSLAEIPHKHRRYLIFYTATFTAGDKAAVEPTADKPTVEGPVAGTTTSESPASGFATVVWDVVLVRDAPKTGTVVGRIMRGSRVKVMAHQGEWYRVTFGTTEGWVYRGTIGL
jgi:hypothetical protein